jgi:hypothetical protein
MDEYYEAVYLTRKQAQEVAELLGNGSVMFSARNGSPHAYPGARNIVRPMGCTCANCSVPSGGAEHG